MDPDAVAKAFVEHYYRTFDTNRAALVGLYQEASMLTFEGHKFQGPAAIAGKLGSLPFQQCEHQIVTVDCQPSGPTGGMLVFVSGSIRTGPEEHPIKFSQVCNPAPPRSGSSPLLSLVGVRLILIACSPR
ncbi:Nuclear transport factor 2 [Dichanthelium oligosanthes]|uniref:Nuclear transport factor 2 n=1 Tax=Dichanthelium oligosanthes TaxID=888268 RepID=A0A1E5V7C7_9POAL|nr:Nuclear transport factor 2 [Dichanthelium oligosanthes]